MATGAEDFSLHTKNDIDCLCLVIWLPSNGVQCSFNCSIYFVYGECSKSMRLFLRDTEAERISHRPVVEIVHLVMFMGLKCQMFLVADGKHS